MPTRKGNRGSIFCKLLLLWYTEFPALCIGDASFKLLPPERLTVVSRVLVTVELH